MHVAATSSTGPSALRPPRISRYSASRCSLRLLYQATLGEGRFLVIRRLQLSDFKAFHDLRLDFAPLTILLGPNNSGKSSIIAAVRLLAQTMQSADPDLPLLLDGPMGDFGT